MPFTVQQLIEGHLQPITVNPQTTVKQALELMIEYDFSQLPVVDENNKPLGIVTNESILRTLNNFDVLLDALEVSHTTVKVHLHKPDDDLFELLDNLKDTYAVLIKNNEDKLIGIVTSYDTTEYFRKRSEDMMYVEDIEGTLKDYIQTAFGAGNDDTGSKELADAIAVATDNGLQKKFLAALSHYISKHDKSSGVVNLDLAKELFSKHFEGKADTKTFDDLTLNEYIQLLLDKNKWPHFNSVFSLKSQAVSNLLHGVRKTRNDLAHFHGELSPQQRDQLRFCAEWLERHRTKVLEAFPSKAAELAVMQPVNISEAMNEHTNSSQVATVIEAVATEANTITEEVHMESIPIMGAPPLDEATHPGDSRYAPLAIWLLQRPPNEEQVVLIFKSIEELMHDKLPASARKHRAWWSNHLESNPQARQWWDAGWRVSYVDMEKELVQFTRINERENSYNDFFHSLYTILSQKADFALRAPSTYLRNWITVTQIFGYASFGYAFTYRRRFRVELYIDTGNKEKNKRIFDELYQVRSEIESMLEGISGKLEWERIDDKRASRVALYHSGAISDTPPTLNKLKTWAVDAMLRFKPVMERYVSEAPHDL